MHTAEIVDLARERRLSAVLDVARNSADLLVLNGGSKAEEITILTSSRGRTKSSRAVYCIDSGTSMHLRLPVPPGQTSRDLVVRIVGEHGAMLLRQPPAPRSTAARLQRLSVAALTAAACFIFSSGQTETSPIVVASADPVPVLAEPPLVHAKVSLRTPTTLPPLAIPLHPLSRPTAAARSAKLSERREIVALAPLPVAANNARVLEAQTPPPHMKRLNVPQTAKSGDYIPVRFEADSGRVKIVASIGPTVVKTVLASSNRGQVSIQSPQSVRLSRVMTVRAYAQNGKHSSSLQAMVVLVHP